MGPSFVQGCQLCAAPAVHRVLDLGPQPICNRFLSRSDEPEHTTALVLAVCERCGLAQLTEGPSAADLRPRSGWITYTEPEAHVATLASTLATLPGVSPDALVVGLSLKDDSLLQRLKERGFTRCHRLEPGADLQIEEPAGVESVQARLTPERAAALVERYGPAQVVIARHVLEHAHALPVFLDALTSLLAPGGYLVLEVPDCEAAFDLCDYTTIWEEHTLYFTQATFRSVFDAAGMSLTSFDVFPYPLENSLVGIGQRAVACPTVVAQPQTAERECRRLDAFGRSLPQHRESLQQFLGAFRDREGEVALFGAGHLGCAFVNFLQLVPYVSFAVDDNPHKQGLFLPGSRLPIRPSSSLEDERVRMCLLAMSPAAETTLAERHRGFASRGGVLASIFPSSPRALRAARHA